MGKMIDLGKKINENKPIPVDSVDGDKKVFYPTLYIDQHPEDFKGKAIGDVCRLEVVVAVKGLREDSIELEVRKMKHIANGEKLTKEEYLNMDDDKREEYERKMLSEGPSDEDDDG